MRRSTGVTINAVVLLLASVAGFLFLLLLLVQGIARTGGDPAVENVAKIGAGGFIAMMEGIPCWAFATGIGLLRLRRWARTCSVVISAVIGLVITLSLLFIGAVTALSWHDADRGAIDASTIVTILAWALAAVYCGWWAYFFQTRSVKEQFGFKEYVRPAIPRAPIQARPVGPVTLPVIPVSAAKQAQRPASITIVAVFFLIGAAGAVFSLPAYAIFHTPVPFFGAFLSGWFVPLLALAMGGFSAAAGTGLLKMKTWARPLGIYFLTFGSLNSLVTLLRPRSIARFEESMEASQLQFLPNQPGTENFQATAHALSHAWLRLMIPATLIVGVILAAVQIYLLIRRKQAFIDADQSSAANS